MKSYNGFSPKQRMDGDKILKAAIAAGTWSFEKKCLMCGTTEGHIWIHNEDYNRPIEDARPLCVACHMALHKRFSFPNRWRLFCLWLRAGNRSPGYRTNGEYFVKHPYPKNDLEDVVFTPDPSKWWEMLSTTPQEHP